MKLFKPLAMALLALAAQVPALAGELAVLRNGFSIRHDRREQVGNLTRLYTGGGYVDIPTEQIISFEKEETPVPEPAGPRVAPPQPPVAPAELGKVDIDQLVRDASSRRQIDPDFVNSVIKYESNFQPRAVSSKGAQGLMQLMPRTAAQLGVKNAFDPKANVEAGTEYLGQLLDLYQNDPIKALAAYNAGAHRVEQYHGVPPYRETQLYISHIVRDYNRKKLAQMKGVQPAPSVEAQSLAKTQGKKQPKTASTLKAVSGVPADSVKKPASASSKNGVQRVGAANLQNPAQAPAQPDY
ncbi:MAG TPA: lytic transglycosylase domain-containing protein [Candidatus Saccharimonadales bacterium]|jgi:soluble lytic murein transglycosylase-like protein|nr:lytic transglycosylase domain-containing protein [Candidatus Saccharimonadales bacterium]